MSTVTRLNINEILFILGLYKSKGVKTISITAIPDTNTMQFRPDGYEEEQKQIEDIKENKKEEDIKENGKGNICDFTA